MECKVPHIPHRRCLGLDGMVITAADDHSIQGAVVMLHSLRHHHECLTRLYDIGVTNTHASLLEKLRSWGVEIVDGRLLRRGIGPGSAQRGKPRYIDHAIQSSDRVIWLDADCVVTDHIHEMPREFVADHGRSKCRVENSPIIDHVLGPVGSELQPNTGVLSFARGSQLLAEWLELSERTQSDAVLARGFTYWDQGPLTHIVNRDIIPLADGRVWNCIVHDRLMPDEMVRLWAGPQKILHFAGTKKYWHRWCGAVVRDWPVPRIPQTKAVPAEVQAMVNKIEAQQRSVQTNQESRQIARSATAPSGQLYLHGHFTPEELRCLAEPPRYARGSLGEVFVTALSCKPSHVEPQQRALTSWRDAGATIVAMNSTREIDVLRKSYPQVDRWLECNDLSDGYEYPTQRIVNLARVACEMDRRIVLINSDIEVRATQSQLKRFLDCEFAAGIRWDYQHSHSTAREYEWGIDAFTFTPEQALALPDDMPLAIGQPMWDYVVPAILAATRATWTPTFLHERIFFHRQHATNWSKTAWRRGRDWLRQRYGVGLEYGDATFRRNLDPLWHYDRRRGRYVRQ